MKLVSLPLAAVAACLALSALGADTPEDVKKREEIRALILADAQSKAAPPAKAKTDTEPVVSPTPAPAPEAPPQEAKPEKATAQQEPPTMLPQMEVNQSRITEIDLEIAAQNKAIAREKAAAKPTKLDDTLNNAKLSKTLSFLGGSSSDDRSAIADERVRLMEEEKDLLEALKLARTKEEKAEIQQEIDALRAERRELDGAPK
ncbi:MAG: hypothetical protein JSR48_08385 [Verrucomicrobia bacterium]|nr:hypothetical protein [Verrucomicrobiota bacterium]